MIPKFRVWCKNRKEWERDVCYIQQDGLLYQRSKGSERLIPILSKNHAVMHSTGLKDKNGVEIYEGDIVKVTSIQDGEYYTTDVYWGGKDGYPAFDLNAEHISSDWFYDSNILSAVFVNSAYESIEILGSIHENPELLNLR